MNRAVGAAVLVAGVLVLLGGIAAPATDTHRSVACVDSTWDAADGCVESTYTTPNFGKGIMITMGLMAALVGGGIIALSSADGSGRSSIAREPTSNDGPAENTLEARTVEHAVADGEREGPAENTLEARIRQRDSDTNSEE